MRLQVFLLLSFALVGCTQEARLETPTPVAPTSINLQYSAASSPTWQATLDLDSNGMLARIAIFCDGEAYAEAREVDVPYPVFGARADSYSNSECSSGPFELTVYSIPPPQILDAPSMYAPVVFYFRGGAYTGQSEVRIHSGPTQPIQ